MLWVVILSLFSVNCFHVSCNVITECYMLRQDQITEYVQAARNFEARPQYFSIAEFVEEFLEDDGVRSINYIDRVFGNDTAFNITETLWNIYVSYERADLEILIGLR